MKLFKKVYKQIKGFFKIKKKINKKYEKIQKNPDLAAKSLELGNLSIVHSIVAMLLIVLCVYGIYNCNYNIAQFKDVNLGYRAAYSIGLALCTGSIASIFLKGFVASALYIFYQIKLNKNIIRIIAIIVWIFCIILTIALSLFINYRLPELI